MINRTPSILLNGKTPYELLYGSTPHFERLKVFGCLFFAHSKSHDKDKFGERSRNMFLLGIYMVKKDGVCLILRKRSIMSPVMLCFMRRNFHFLDFQLLF